MQSSESHEITEVLIDLIGTEDNEDESRPDPITFSTAHPGINSALVAAQSTARPAAFNRQANFTSSSESSSLRDRSGRFNFDRLREGLAQYSVPQSHSDVSTLSWSRSVGTHGEAASPPAEEPHVIDLAEVPLDPSTLPVWQNIAGLFDLMQSQMTSLSRALELARTDSDVLRQRCLELESQLGIKSTTPASSSPSHADLSRVPQLKLPDDLRSLTPPREPSPERLKQFGSDPALTFIRNIDELIWRRSLFSKSPAELAVLASLPDCVRNNDDVLDSRNLAAMEERIRLWESIVRRTQT
ncbi:hypothetical protein OPQ81_011495 [Rhizoctonia solani]|nr:hypothetical protein OPQ81_011495 [Rhizoctonia solani]